MLNELIAIKPDEISKLNDTELDNYVNDCSVRILEKIEASDKKIKAAKDQASKASDMKTGFFGKTAKKTTAVADGLVSTNEAVAEMNDLLQEIINFVCLSLKFAQKMHASIEHMITEGFTGRDGQYHTLTESSKKIALRVLDESSKYAKNQIENELKDKEQDDKIAGLFNKFSEKDVIDIEQSQRLDQLHTLLDQKEQIDTEQSQRLEELKALLHNKDNVDRNQEDAIQKNKDAIRILYEYMEQKSIIDKDQQNQINSLLNRGRNSLPIVSIVASIFALIASIISLLKVFELF